MGHTKWKVNNSIGDNGEIIPKVNKEFGGQKYFAITVKDSFECVGFFYPCTPCSEEKMIADAKLIAQAPELLSQRDELVELLHDAGIQIEYLHDKFSETGTGNNVLSRIKSLLTKINTKP